MTAASAPELTQLGDDLERAAGRHLAAGRRRTRVRRAGLAVVALTVLATGSAVAAGLFSPKQVAAGMPAGTAIFGNTHPTCALDADSVTYHCTLDAAPQDDSIGVAPIAKPGMPAVASPALPPDYMGWTELIGIDGVVAGGCIGRSHDGLRWDCYVGSEAVTRQILVEDLLGQPMTGPGHG